MPERQAALIFRTSHDLGDLLRDGGLTGAVVIQIQMLYHLAGVLGGGIHGGAAGGQLTGHALAHGTVEDTRHILGDDSAEHFLAAGFVQDLAPAGLGLLGSVGSMVRGSTSRVVAVWVIMESKRV